MLKEKFLKVPHSKVVSYLSSLVHNTRKAWCIQLKTRSREEQLVERGRRQVMNCLGTKRKHKKRRGRVRPSRRKQLRRLSRFVEGRSIPHKLCIRKV